MEHATFQHMPCYYPTKLNKICDKTPASPMFFYKVIAFVAICRCIQPWFVSSCRVRCPIGLRSVSDWVAFAVRSGCVRRPIGFRSGDDEVA